MWDWDNGTWIEYNGNKFNLELFAYSDKYLDDVFSFKTHLGNVKNSLDDPNSVVLVKPIADKIFGNENPIGKTILLNNKPTVVNAILEPIPSNSSIHVSGLVSYKSAKRFFGNDIADWSNIPFVLAKKDLPKISLRESINQTYLQSLPSDERKRFESKLKTKLVSISDLYFYDEGLHFNPIKHGSKTLAYIILTIGITILFLAIINYNNLSLATSLKWNKEFGIQKIMGAAKNSGKKQMYIKGLIIASISFLISILLIKAILPWFNTLVTYPLHLNEFISIHSIAIALILLLITIILSGILPWLLFKKSSPVELIKVKQGNYFTKGTVWKTLVTFQLFISITLLTSAIVISKQISFGLKKDIGLQVKNVITLPTSKLGSHKTAFINNISNHPKTISNCLSASYINIASVWGGELNSPDRESQKFKYNIIRANHSFLETVGLELKVGRNFNGDNPSDINAYIINEKAVKEYGISNPLETTLNGNPILGVVKDFNFNSLHHQIQPVAIWNTPKHIGMSSIYFEAKTKEDVKSYMDFLRKEWTALAPEKPFEYEFLDERLASMYEKDIKLAKSVISFSLLAVFIACLGIFGLLTYIMETKIKEIGIRKVNGARILEILKLINLDLVRWVCIAAFISTPISWFIMKRWLENFAYRTEMNWWIFIASGALALLLTLLTVSWQSWRTARRNPVEALRYE